MSRACTAWEWAEGPGQASSRLSKSHRSFLDNLDEPSCDSCLLAISEHLRVDHQLAITPKPDSNARLTLIERAFYVLSSKASCCIKSDTQVLEWFPYIGPELLMHGDSGEIPNAPVDLLQPHLVFAKDGVTRTR